MFEGYWDQETTSKREAVVRRVDAGGKVTAYSSDDTRMFEAGGSALKFIGYFEANKERAEAQGVHRLMVDRHGTMSASATMSNAGKQGCPDSAQGDGKGGKAEYCVQQVGESRCQHEGYPNLTHGDGRGGKAEYCVQHGGGPHCQGVAHSGYADPKDIPAANLRHGDTSLRWQCFMDASGGTLCRAILSWATSCPLPFQRRWASPVTSCSPCTTTLQSVHAKRWQDQTCISRSLEECCS